MAETDRSNQRWWLSDGLLGAMVVILTAATAFAAYQSATTGIEGDDLDVESQKQLVLATGSFLSSNAELIQDLQAYDSYRYFSSEDPNEAAVYLDRMSGPLKAGLEKPGGPLDDAYLVDLYAGAGEMLDQVEALESQANLIDEQNRIYELAGFIFAIGLASTAWASLVDASRQLRLIFLIIAVVCLVGGFAVIILQI